MGEAPTKAMVRVRVRIARMTSGFSKVADADDMLLTAERNVEDRAMGKNQRISSSKRRLIPYK